VHGNNGTEKINRKPRTGGVVDAIVATYDDAGRKLTKVARKLRQNDRAEARAFKFATRTA
jgi:hypothetical protein